MKWIVTFWSRVWLPLTTVLLVCSVVMSEQASSRARKDTKKHVEFWVSWTGFEFDAIHDVVKDFNASQKEIQVDLLTVGNLATKTLLSVSAGIPPDLVVFSGPQIPQIVDARSLEELTPLTQKHGIRKEDYIESYWQFGEYQGGLYSLPICPATMGLLYNRDILEAAGYKRDQVPETFEELFEYSVKLTKMNGSKVVTAGFLPAEPGWWNYNYGPLFGGSLWDGGDNVTPDHEGNVRAMTWIQEFSKKFGASNIQQFKSGLGNFASPENGFLAGKVGMEIQGVWMNNFVEQYSPKLNWGVVDIPYPKDMPELKGRSMVDSDVIVIPKGSKVVDATGVFLEYLLSQPVIEKFCAAHQKTTALKKKSPEFWANHKNPYIRFFDDLGLRKNYIAPPKIGVWAEYQAELVNAYEVVALQQKSPKDALLDVKNRIQPMFEKYRERLKAREAAGK
ncbi:MAG TPA: ABC transporter substrate-binding protein [Fimbriimonas sp.]|nr:ABC transporter substrate-binding protein [Fimbriimonas sp.]